MHPWIVTKKANWRRNVGLLLAAVSLGGLTPGCTGDARVELAAADAIREIAGSLDVAVDEYDRQFEMLHELRSRDVAMALAARLGNGSGDDAVDADVEAFLAATARLRADYRAGVRRFAATEENVALLREVAEGLGRLAADSLSLGDEGRRYFSSVLGMLRDSAAQWITRKARMPSD